VIVGTVAFAGLGLAMAGWLRGEVNLAAANALYLVLLLLGGMIFPLDELPSGLAQVAQLLPSAALAEVLRAALTTGAAPARAWLTLLAWAVTMPLVAARTFRWE
jgi:ABC-2 type transport system permease protein